jgi:GAF domain-containing protein
MHRIAFATMLAGAAGLAQAKARTYAYEAELAQAVRGAAATAGGVSGTYAGTRCTARHSGRRRARGSPAK